MPAVRDNDVFAISDLIKPPGIDLSAAGFWGGPSHKLFKEGPGEGRGCCGLHRHFILCSCIERNLGSFSTLAQSSCYLPRGNLHRRSLQPCTHPQGCCWASDFIAGFTPTSFLPSSLGPGVKAGGCHQWGPICGFLIQLKEYGLVGGRAKSTY